MTYDAVVTTNDGKHTYQNIEAKNEQHLIEIKKTFIDFEEVK